MSGSADTPRGAVELAARQSYGRLLAFIAARTGNLAEAEDALSEAFASALSTWPVRGVPRSPEGWLLTAARRRLIDMARRRHTSAAAEGSLRLLAEEVEAGRGDDADIPDDRLRLMFACTHPALGSDVRAPLMLQTVLGFDAATIASAFLVSPVSMGQRLVRAKRKIQEAGIPFRVPDRDELGERLETVLDAIYALYAEGWVDPAGTVARERELTAEAIWLGRLVATLLPDEPEVHGLLALMLHAEARRNARRGPDGDYVPLAEQDIRRWRTELIEEAEALLRHAGAAGRIGRFQLEAAVQSAHAARRLTGRIDWEAIVGLYDVLLALTGSPVVAINRAAAVGELCGAAAAVAALDRLSADRRLVEYQPYWAARANFLALNREWVGAAEAYQRAIGLESDPAVRAFLERRRAALGGAS